MDQYNTTAVKSKEDIAARMFKSAVRTWNEPDAEIENFDPLVKMLIEACSVELYRVGNEISAVQERMIERLARLLTPQVYTAPRPAHGIMHARSVEPLSTVAPHLQFVHKKKVPSRTGSATDSTIDLFFSPAGRYRTFNGDVKYIAYNNSVCQVNAEMGKDVIFKTSPNKEKLSPNHVWIGLDVDREVKDLSGISFYFDLKNYPAKQKLLSLTSYTKWQMNGQPVPITGGLWDAETGTKAFATFDGFDEFDISKTVEKDINNFYSRQFVTIEKGVTGSYKPEQYPPEFENHFLPEDLAKIRSGHLWIKITFEVPLDEVALEALNVLTNCFPVANRRLVEKWYRLQNNVNIIPLVSSEQFLAIRNVQGTENGLDGGNKYTNVSLGAGEVVQKGGFMLRTGGVERFDGRNALEYMDYLLELLRDESRAFAALGQDFVATLVETLNQNIAQATQKVKSSITQLNQAPTYLMLNPLNENENIFVEYWTTNGDAGNQVRSGTRLNMYSGADLKRESIVLLTTTAGGTDSLKNTEALNAYKNIVTTRGRIVTMEDIKSYCSMQLANIAQKITIEKGVTTSELPRQGLINTIFITVVPKVGSGNDEQWKNELHRLQIGLTGLSSPWAHYTLALQY